MHSQTNITIAVPLLNGQKLKYFSLRIFRIYSVRFVQYHKRIANSSYKRLKPAFSCKIIPNIPTLNGWNMKSSSLRIIWYIHSHTLSTWNKCTLHSQKKVTTCKHYIYSFTLKRCNIKFHKFCDFKAYSARFSEY